MGSGRGQGCSGGAATAAACRGLGGGKGGNQSGPTPPTPPLQPSIARSSTAGTAPSSTIGPTPADGPPTFVVPLAHVWRHKHRRAAQLLLELRRHLLRGEKGGGRPACVGSARRGSGWLCIVVAAATEHRARQRSWRPPCRTLSPHPRPPSNPQSPTQAPILRRPTGCLSHPRGLATHSARPHPHARTHPPTHLPTHPPARPPAHPPTLSIAYTQTKTHTPTHTAHLLLHYVNLCGCAAHVHDLVLVRDALLRRYGRVCG